MTPQPLNINLHFRGKTAEPTLPAEAKGQAVNAIHSDLLGRVLAGQEQKNDLSVLLGALVGGAELMPKVARALLRHLEDGGVPAGAVDADLRRVLAKMLKRHRRGLGSWTRNASGEFVKSIGLSQGVKA